MRIDEAPDEPGASKAIDLWSFTCDPLIIDDIARHILGHDHAAVSTDEPSQRKASGGFPDRWLDFGDMRLFVLLLCLLLNVSFLLAPFSHVHAHLGQLDDSALVHGGHSHDFDAHESADHHADDWQDHDVEHVIDLDSERAGQIANGLTWSQWLPLLCMVGLLFSMAPSRAFLLPRPPRSRPVLSSQHPPWPPPLRGPPISI